MMKLFIKFELEKIHKYFKTKTLAKSITSLLFIIVFSFVGLGIYGFFVTGFRFISIEAVEDIRLALTLFLYETFLLILSGIIVFSVLISGVFTLFRGDYNTWIMSSPGYKIIPKVVLIKSLLNSLLPSVIMFVPAVLAFNKVHSLGVFSLLSIILAVFLLLVIVSTLTLLTLLLVSALYYKISKKFSGVRFSFKGLIGVLIVLIGVCIVSLFKLVRSIDLVQVFRADSDSAVLSVQTISDHFVFLPTHPFALLLLNLQNANASSAFGNLLVLLALAALGGSLWWKVSYRFYPIWQKFQEVTSRATHSSYALKPSYTYLFTGTRTMALFKKETLVSSRNWKGILWFSFLMVLWFAQVGTNIIIGNNIDRAQTGVEQKVAILQALQFIIAIYFISSFSLRFVFPSFSVEKKTSWILSSAPLSFKKIFFGKYFFYTTFFTILGLMMSSINSSVLSIPFTFALYSMVLLITTIIFIVTLGLSLGALFPSLDTDDPEAVTTSMPGLFFTALALMYGAMSSLVLYTTLLRGTTALVVFFSTLTLIFTALFLVFVPKAMKKRSLQER